MEEIIQCLPHELKYIKNYSQLKWEDYNIYDRFLDKFNVINRPYTVLKPIKKTLAHREIANETNYLNKFTFTTYDGLFSWIRNYYDSTKTSF